MLGEQQSGLCEFLDGQRMKVLAEKVETERRVRLGALSLVVDMFRACPIGLNLCKGFYILHWSSR
jgi:hypothetical protein